MRKSGWVAGGVAVAVGAIYLSNASWLAAAPAGQPKILAHRGIHQTFPMDGVGNDTCTASRIRTPTNPYLENTIPSMRATFSAGADALELDIHPTTDGEFAVFHDWKLECRTNGRGVTRDQSMAYLRTLDVGYGYTADRGNSHPFRGKGLGLTPTLHEVLSTFPDKQFVINIKSRDPTEGSRLVEYLRERGHPTDRRLLVYGDERPLAEVARLAPSARVWSGRSAKACALRYLAFGWSGYVPKACIGRAIGVPLNYSWLYWGWPNRLQARMHRANVDIVVAGPVHKGDHGARGVDSPAELARVPQSFVGTIMTNDIEAIGLHAGLRRGIAQPMQRAASR